MAMDLGFGGFIEKFEEYFGRRATRLLLITIGAAIIAVCFGAVWEWVVLPLLEFFAVPGWPNLVAGAIYLVAGLVMGALAATMIVGSFGLLRYRSQVRRDIRENERELARRTKDADNVPVG